MRRCRFFFNVFGLELPDYLSCHQFSDSNNPDICVGQKQMRDIYSRALKPGDQMTKNRYKISLRNECLYHHNIWRFSEQTEDGLNEIELLTYKSLALLNCSEIEFWTWSLSAVEMAYSVAIEDWILISNRGWIRYFNRWHRSSSKCNLSAI